VLKSVTEEQECRIRFDYPREPIEFKLTFQELRNKVAQKLPQHTWSYIPDEGRIRFTFGKSDVVRVSQDHCDVVLVGSSKLTGAICQLPVDLQINTSSGPEKKLETFQWVPEARVTPPIEGMQAQTLIIASQAIETWITKSQAPIDAQNGVVAEAKKELKEYDGNNQKERDRLSDRHDREERRLEELKCDKSRLEDLKTLMGKHDDVVMTVTATIVSD
jgi:hypothetical protein